MPYPRLSLLLPCCALLGACASRHPHRDPSGELFPSVVGNSLDGTEVRLPEDFEGQQVVLLIGYDQDAQFDADRWLFGLLQAEIDVPVREVPTIPGFVPGLISGTIDGGMRGGIPPEDWASVVTVYGDGDQIARFTGSEQGQNMRAVLLDRDGKVAFFHDSGYSARVLLQMLERIEQLRSQAGPATAGD